MKKAASICTHRAGLQLVGVFMTRIVTGPTLDTLNRIETMPERHIDIDKAKGLAMLLVVFGHISARKPPDGNEWYVASRYAIYGFHMAFFMFLSGLVFFMNLKVASSWRDVVCCVKKRFGRLIIPYLLFGVLVILAKWTLQSFVHVDNPVDGPSGLLEIVLWPMESSASFLWYVYVLFLFSAFSYLLLRATGGDVSPLVLIGYLLLFVPEIQLFAVGQFCK